MLHNGKLFPNVEIDAIMLVIVVAELFIRNVISFSMPLLSGITDWRLYMRSPQTMRVQLVQE